MFLSPLSITAFNIRRCEQLFQMLKFTDTETLQLLHKCRGMNVKYQAKGAEKLGLRRSDWGQIIVDAMKFCLQTKYVQSAEFRQALKDTTGKTIVEDQTTQPKKQADTWGAKLIDGHFIGPNLLGRLLMELRDNGHLDYHLPADMFTPLYFLRSTPQ